MRRLLVLLLMIGCNANSDVRDGTFVGNPGKLDVSVTDVPGDISLDGASLSVERVYLESCEDEDHLDDTQTTLDALGADPTGIEVPYGLYCGALLTPGTTNPLMLSGATTGGTTFQITLDPGELVVTDAFYVDDTWLLWTLPMGSLDAGAIEALGADVVIDATDQVALDVQSGLVDASGLYEDVDQDGLLGDNDFLASAPPAGIPSDTGTLRGVSPPNADAATYATSEKSDAGCGCETSSRGGGLVALVILALLAGRRRTRVHP